LTAVNTLLQPLNVSVALFVSVPTHTGSLTVTVPDVITAVSAGPGIPAELQFVAFVQFAVPVQIFVCGVKLAKLARITRACVIATVSGLFVCPPEGTSPVHCENA
jgi:hypothetical protein